MCFLPILCMLMLRCFPLLCFAKIVHAENRFKKHIHVALTRCVKFLFRFGTSSLILLFWCFLLVFIIQICCMTYWDKEKKACFRNQKCHLFRLISGRVSKQLLDFVWKCFLCFCKEHCHNSMIWTNFILFVCQDFFLVLD